MSSNYLKAMSRRSSLYNYYEKTSSGRVLGIKLISITGGAPVREKLYQKTQHYYPMVSSKSIGHVNIGIVFLFVGNSHDAYAALSNSDWLFHTQQREL